MPRAWSTWAAAMPDEPAPMTHTLTGRSLGVLTTDVGDAARRSVT
jgi:hypothetical protein